MLSVAYYEFCKQLKIELGILIVLLVKDELSRFKSRVYLIVESARDMLQFLNETRVIDESKAEE